MRSFILLPGKTDEISSQKADMAAPKLAKNSKPGTKICIICVDVGSLGILVVCLSVCKHVVVSSLKHESPPISEK